MATLAAKETIQGQHSLMAILSFVVLGATNVLIIVAANALFPQQVVLGSLSAPYWWAVHHSIFKLTIINLLAMFGVTIYEWKTRSIFTPQQWMLTYFGVNLIALWVITRFAEQLGLGVSAWWVLVILAIVFDWLQGVVMMALGKIMQNKLS